MLRRLSFGLLTAVLLSQAHPLTAEAQTRPVYIAVFHRPGPNYDKTKDFRHQPNIQGHVDYLYGLYEAGLLVAGGPFLDMPGGMAVFQGDPAVVKAKVMADPTVKSGLLRPEIHRWMVPFSRIATENPHP